MNKLRKRILSYLVLMILMTSVFVGVPACSSIQEGYQQSASPEATTEAEADSLEIRLRDPLWQKGINWSEGGGSLSW